MPKLVLEPIKAEKPKKKKKKREAPGENHFADRQARIDEYNRIQALTDVEEAALKRELREKEVAAVVERETREKEEAKAQARADGDGPGQGGSSFSSAIERQLGKAWKELGAEEKKQGSWWIIALPPVPGNRPIRPRGGSRGSSCSC